MDEVGFRAWLLQKYSLKTVSSRLSEIRRLDASYGGLEEHFRKDGLASIMASLTYSAIDRARGEPNPSLISLAPEVDVFNNLASYKKTVSLFRQYMSEFGTSVAAPDGTSSLQAVNPALATLSVPDLLKLQIATILELRRRNVVRTNNSPAGDYAELLFATAFNWRLEAKSSAGYDAIDDAGIRYQIKCRRVTQENGSRQLSAMRRLDARPFDILAAVLFDADFRVLRAALIPIEIVLTNVKFMSHVNAHRFLLRDTLWSLPGVKDATESLRAAERGIL